MVAGSVLRCPLVNPAGVREVPQCDEEDGGAITTIETEGVGDTHGGDLGRLYVLWLGMNFNIFGTLW